MIERWLNARNWGKVRDADGFAKIKGPCGDTMQISIKVKNNQIFKIRFLTDGCASTAAQFMKGEWPPSGELLVAPKLDPLLTIKPMGRSGFTNLENPDPEDKMLAQKGLALAKELMESEACDIRILG